MNPAADRDTRPLYVRVRDRLVDRIRSGAWKPGQLIPNEFEIAAEFGVSQGTARKAIGALASDHLVLRRQGIGTFVVEHTPAQVLFRFFNVFDDSGVQILPDSVRAAPVLAEASPEECAALALQDGDRVVRISRIRTRDGQPFISESITLPEAIFPGLADRYELPNTLYDLFQKSYGILVTKTDDRLTAVSAGAEVAQALGVPVGSPLLRIERIAFGLDEKRVEWRISLCHLQNAHYLARAR
jgi:GntR family transcriptional regulator